MYQKCALEQPFNRLLDLKIGKCLALQGNYEAALLYFKSEKGKFNEEEYIFEM